MLSTRRNAFRLLALTLALSLVAVALVALACAPAAPAVQDDPTPEPTATSEPADTSTPEPTPTLFLINNGTPWPVDHPVEKKYSNLSSDLNRLALEHEEAQSSARGASGQSAQQPEVEVIITPDSAESIPAIVRFLKDNGASPTYDWAGLSNDGYGGPNDLAAIVPVSLLARLSQLQGVFIVEEEAKPAPANRSGSPSSQGNRNPADAHGATVWNPAGHEGDGIAVGIIDRGFTEFRTRVMPTITARGAAVKSLCFPASGTRTPTETNISVCENEQPNNYHGITTSRAVLDTAPNVSLYISNPDTPYRLKYAVDWMLRKGVRVINMSQTWPWDGPGDGSSPFQSPQTLDSSPLDTLDDAVRRGVIWINAAGNEAKRTWFSRTVTVSQSDWLDFDLHADEISDIDDCNSITLRQNAEYHFQLRWNDTWRGANIDLDLHLYRGSNRGRLVDSSTDTQDGGSRDDPIEGIVYRPSATATYCLAVSHESGALPSWIQLQVRLGDFSKDRLQHYTGSGSIANPAESNNPGMLAVGASSLNPTPVIRQTSSRGPVPNMTATPKPDIVGGNTAELAGTSQSSPHVAGLAALVVQAFTNPSGTPPAPTRVVGFLKQYAQPRSESVPAGTPTPRPGRNNTWGHGFAYLPTLTPTPTPQPPPMPTGLTGTAGNRSITLDWNDAPRRATGYQVQQWDGRARRWRTLPFRESHVNYSYTISFNGSGATVGKLTNGVTYSHKVRAVNSSGSSAWTRYISTAPTSGTRGTAGDVTPTPPPPAQ